MNNAAQNHGQSETLLLFRRLIPDKRLRWSLFVLAWVVIGTLSMMHWRVLPRSDHPYTFWELYRVKLVLWVLWGLFTPLILKLSARWRIEGPNLAKGLIVTFLLSLGITSLYLAAYTEILSLNIGFDYARANMYEFVFQTHSSYYYLAFWMTVGVEHAIGLYNRYHERQMRMVQLESQLTQTQLKVLRGRLQPHFLFNTLHSIVALMRKKENEVATAMLTKLSDLLRASLEHLDRQEVVLADELNLVGRFIDIEKIRFSDRLNIIVEADEATRLAYVPSFILQPIVENAIKHGIEKRAGGGVINISAEKLDNMLCMKVSDNGTGLSPSNPSAKGWGIGLETTRTRLETMYPNLHSFEIIDDISGGVSVIIKLPFRTSSEPVEGEAHAGN